MVDRPILFSAPMVLALLAGRKTQTRRKFTPPLPFADGDDISVEIATGSIKPRIAVGDRLWVKETAWFDREVIPAIGALRAFFEGGTVRFEDGATGQAPGHPDVHTAEMFEMTSGIKKRSGLLMPRWASRLTLIVEDVNVARLQDISEADAITEGVSEFGIAEKSGRRHFGVAGHEAPIDEPSARMAYSILWDWINGAGSWHKNPWVVAYRFSCIPQNIDQIGGAA